MTKQKCSTKASSNQLLTIGMTLLVCHPISNTQELSTKGGKSILHHHGYFLPTPMKSLNCKAGYVYRIAEKNSMITLQR
jgi:hypothetical protein